MAVDYDKLKEMYVNNVSPKQIAKEFGVTLSAINYFLRKFNLRASSDKYKSKITPEMGVVLIHLHEERKNCTEIAKILSLSTAAVRSFLKRNHMTPNLDPMVDISRPCFNCGIVFKPKYSDGPKKAKYKSCSSKCASDLISKSNIKYNQEQVDQVIKLKKLNTPNDIIEKSINVNINKIKEIVKENKLFLSNEVRQENAYRGKLNRNPQAMTQMREAHMELSESEFNARVRLVERDVLAGLGSAHGLSRKHGLIGVSVAEVFRREGKEHLLEARCSTDQLSIHAFVQGFFSERVLFDNREVIAPKEIDIYVESKKVGIEFHGLYWHTEQKVGKDAHQNKLKRANSVGIRLISIFEHEWQMREKQVKNFLKSSLGVFERKIHGRKTVVRPVNPLEAKRFLENNHIQGAAKTTKAYFGLYLSDELLGVMSLGKHHRNSASSSIVLDRLCFLDGVVVRGGASKLLRTAVEWARQKGYEKILSWSDNRWSEGDVYLKMGFNLEEELKPDFFYFKKNRVFSKQSCQKKHLLKKGAKGVTEKEMAQNLGYSRIWDCGKKRWVLVI